VKLLLTGATGFVGSALCERLLSDGRHAVRVALRRDVDTLPAASERCVVGDLDGETNWRAAVAGIDVVVHAAARAHVMHDTAVDPLAEFRRINVAATLNLARQAAAAGARRFVYLSSIKVNGEATPQGRPFRADDTPHPVDPYGISKHEAEQALQGVAAASGVQVVVIRPPLVYGPGVKANFRALMRAVARGIPLPFGAIDNRRSMVALDNLVDFISTCVEHPAAAGRTLLVSDGIDLSTPDIVRRVARAMQRPARLLPVPPGLLAAFGALVGRRAAIQRLCGSLQVDIAASRSSLGWNPPLDVDAGIGRAVEHFLRSCAR
jgi:nucleoside-diphosphate-sugar epimerase